jgi:hypothetical protein
MSNIRDVLNDERLLTKEMKCTNYEVGKEKSTEISDVSISIHSRATAIDGDDVTIF